MATPKHEKIVSLFTSIKNTFESSEELKNWLGSWNEDKNKELRDKQDRTPEEDLVYTSYYIYNKICEFLENEPQNPDVDTLDQTTNIILNGFLDEYEGNDMIKNVLNRQARNNYVDCNVPGSMAHIASHLATVGSMVRSLFEKRPAIDRLEEAEKMSAEVITLQDKFQDVTNKAFTSINETQDEKEFIESIGPESSFSKEKEKVKADVKKANEDLEAARLETMRNQEELGSMVQQQKNLLHKMCEVEESLKVKKAEFPKLEKRRSDIARDKIRLGDTIKKLNEDRDNRNQELQESLKNAEAELAQARQEQTQKIEAINTAYIKGQSDKNVIKGLLDTVLEGNYTYADYRAENEEYKKSESAILASQQRKAYFRKLAADDQMTVQVFNQLSPGFREALKDRLDKDHMKELKKVEASVLKQLQDKNVLKAFNNYLKEQGAKKLEKVPEILNTGTINHFLDWNEQVLTARRQKISEHINSKITTEEAASKLSQCKAAYQLTEKDFQEVTELFNHKDDIQKKFNEEIENGEKKIQDIKNQMKEDLYQEKIKAYQEQLRETDQTLKDINKEIDKNEEDTRELMNQMQGTLFLLSKATARIYDIQTDGVDHQEKKAMEKLNNALKREKACQNVEFKIGGTINSRINLLEQAGKVKAKLAPEGKMIGKEAFTGNPSGKIAKTATELLSKLNAVQKDGWNENKNSDAFVHMRDSLKTLITTVQTKGVNQNELQTALENVREYASKYLAAKKAQDWFILSPSLQRKNRIDTAKNLIEMVDGAMKSLEPNAASDALNRIFSVAEKCKNAPDLQNLKEGDVLDSTVKEFKRTMEVRAKNLEKNAVPHIDPLARV